METYVDYPYYQTQYHGTMPETDFIRLAPRASARLDLLTFGRAAQPPEAFAENIKAACCAITDALLVNEQGGGVASESNDGVTVNYVAGITNTKTDDQRICAAALDHLGTTGLLFRGANT